MELQAADVQVVDSGECEKWHKSFADIDVSGERATCDAIQTCARFTLVVALLQVRIYPDMMCAGHKMGGRDACQGDSGGPLMVEAPAFNNASTNSTLASPDPPRWTLVGLVSAGFSCAQPGRPGIYHRVAKTADWISYASRMTEGETF